MPADYLVQLAVGGVNQSVDASMLSFNEVADAVNVQIKDAKLSCRPGVRVHKLGINGNFQGATFYNPARGMSQQTFKPDASSLVAAIAGRRYQIKPGDSISDAPTVMGLDTTETESSPVYHLSFMKQCENYVIAQDGNGNTWIWDGEAPPQFSTGYSVDDKEGSRLANGASVVAYAHGRIVQVVNNRQILVGDIIHKDSLTDSKNILEMTEQVYWATGSFFSPPSELGQIRAAEILPLRDTAHGHGDLMFHTDEGIFSLDLTKYPRTSWPELAIVKHVLLDTGAAGFYAITIYDGDQIFLSRHGIQTLRSARSESTLIGNPFHPISEPVKRYVDADTREHFKYASVTKFVEQKRLFATTQHIIQSGSNRGARGLLVLNFLPISGGQQAWEGLWTLPKECGLINQTVSGVFDASERLFAFTTDEEGEVYLVEFSRDMPNDVLSDGTSQQIEWQVLTRDDAAGEAAETKTIGNARMTIRDSNGVLSWKTYSRTDLVNWQEWHSGCSDSSQECLKVTPTQDLMVKLGSPPRDTKTGTRFQTLLKFTGCASLEAIKLEKSFDRGGNSTPTPEGECVKLRQEDATGIIYDPFSYSKV